MAFGGIYEQLDDYDLLHIKGKENTMVDALT